MFFKPKWYRLLPDDLKVPSEKLDDLELLRRALGLPHEAFMMSIVISPWAIFKKQESVLEQCRRANPSATEKELWMAVILSRLESILRICDDRDRQGVLARFDSLEQIASKIHSWNDVIKYVFALDKETGVASEGSVTQDEINRVLAGELCITLQQAKLRTT